MSEVEEKYLRARDEITALKRRSNEQEKVITRLKTKLAIIERSLLAQGGTTPAAVELQARVATLEQQKQMLIRKYKEMKLELDRAVRRPGRQGSTKGGSGKVLVAAPKHNAIPPCPPSVAIRTNATTISAIPLLFIENATTMDDAKKEITPFAVLSLSG